GGGVVAVWLEPPPPQPTIASSTRSAVTRATLIVHELPGHAHADRPGNRALHRRGAGAEAAQAGRATGAAHSRERCADLACRAAWPEDLQGPWRGRSGRDLDRPPGAQPAR